MFAGLRLGGGGECNCLLASFFFFFAVFLNSFFPSMVFRTLVLLLFCIII